MIDIKDINGNVIQSVIITQNAERVIELMKADYVQLSWSSDEGTILPAGAYIEYKGEKFSPSFVVFLRIALRAEVFIFLNAYLIAVVERNE